MCSVLVGMHHHVWMVRRGNNIYNNKEEGSIHNNAKEYVNEGGIVRLCATADDAVNELDWRHNNKHSLCVHVHRESSFHNSKPSRHEHALTLLKAYPED